LFQFRALGRPWPEEVKIRFTTPDPKVGVLGAEAVTGVTIGAAMPEPQKTNLIEFCKKARPDIEIRVARTCSDRYELEFLVVQPRAATSGAPT